ncbi:MAG: DUF6599 family protein [Candidatus Acidiferrales bacterium]
MDPTMKPTFARRILPFCVVIMLLAGSSARAQGILPASTSNWNSTESKTQIGGQEAAALKEYGLKVTERRAYSRGTESLVATAYSFGDPSGAYGAYSFLRTPDMAQAKFTKYSSMSRDRALALTGNLVLEFDGKNIGRFHDAIEMLIAQAGGHAAFGTYPALPQRLPADDFVPRSDHYILGPVALQHFLPLANGDWLGFKMGAEAELAHYRLQKSEATLLIADYPTPQIAAAQVEKLSHKLDIVGVTKAASKKEAALYMKRDGTTVALLSGAPSKASADTLLAQVHSGMTVIWDAPIFHKAHEPSMGTMIVGTIVGAGEICGFALLGGLIFAALRLLIKRRWPGQVFDRPEDLEIIQLGLSSKPINAKDLY